MKNIKRTNSGGFTLIELLLVIAIILILIGFLVPKFSSYVNKVKSTKAVNAAKQIQTAAMASYGDNDGKFVKDDVQKSVEELTSAESSIVSADGENNISISYKSDNKDYVVDIDALENTCIVKEKEGLIIYPK